ncbi:MAG: hypothetical protein LBU12_00665 [Deltaproteobacteria bacterium]|jgi:hypothetical protein|nr:hypothetical protein [Deltaproteobacteria bacterium]
MPLRTRRLLAARLCLLASLAVVVAACAPRYEFKPVPVRPMEGYPSRVDRPEARFGALAFYDSKELVKVFGFDLRSAGVVPVQLMIENLLADAPLLLMAAHLLDDQGQLWEVLPSDVVYQRINEHTSGGLAGHQGVRRTLLWGLAGAVAGAAVGVVAGSNVGEAAGKGAAVGGALGATTAIVGSELSSDNADEIQRDFSSRSLDHAAVSPGQTTYGLLYFPAEASRPVKLTIRYKAGADERTLDLAL